MPTVLTREYMDHTFFIPLSADKSEGVFSRPLSKTRRKQLEHASIQEAGHDQNIANEFFQRDVLKECIIQWKGFKDAKGTEIPFSTEILSELCEIDPELFRGIFIRIMSGARFGEIEDLKN